MTAGERHRGQIKYGGHVIPLEIEFGARRHISISVHPDLKVAVRAPEGKTVAEVEERVKQRAKWILGQREKFLEYHPFQPPRKYVGGETHYYLGRQYRLKIEKGDKKSVKLRGKFFHVTTPTPQVAEAIKKQMNEWYRVRAEEIFERRLELCYESAKRNGVPEPKIRIQKMRTRWGSYNPSGVVLLNTELVKMSLYCIDYVIMHELCHLKVPNHSRSFYSLLGRCMPDWEKRKKRMDQMSII